MLDFFIQFLIQKIPFSSTILTERILLNKDIFINRWYGEILENF